MAKAERKLQVAIRIALHTGAREGEIATFVYDEERDQIIIGKPRPRPGCEQSRALRPSAKSSRRG